ncbi:AbrB/MazE/SpoVT family DNA-binding domain-containing protein [Candidatus Fukatsuia symbiotica]|uniref:AbrB family transcriptional regulator n=1 Tax=Candidatus Fukatsuia symbiotica TaxID=1878942 RepID=A0A2U8I7M0_9GAMM|nr:AbrB/MazE/SpoVT family DNA-binding domain-containing protein [Candidatus Fukatsuia symbiotica]AWK15118.1 AbrB family transcriptional regulator [Candidatus Fukatsuia symbiotica]MEA9443932.1 AbrB/MazE/SpoVT family DNA-binding domain-containing protein [Candidatus Fukatsuia symbiotica]
MQVAKWGNSLAVRLPSELIKLLELREGDSIEIIVDEPRVFSVRKKQKVDTNLLERLRTFRGKLPVNFHFNRDEANERN